MIGKVVFCSVLGGTTMAIYLTVFNGGTQFPVHPPLRPIPTVTVPTVTVTVTPTILPKVMPMQPQVAPTPTPTRWPGQHYGETLT